MEKLYDYVEANIKHKSHVVIAGDFDLPGICWQKLEPGASDTKHSEIILNIAFKFDVTQVVNQSTRHGRSADTTLDLVFLSRDLSDYDVSVYDGLSDHDLVSVTLDSNSDRPSRERTGKFVRDFEMASDVDILDYLEMVLYEFERPRLVDEMWEDFRRIVNYCIKR